MSTNKEIIESIRQLNQSLTNTLIEAENNAVSEFHKESIKASAIHIFEKAQLLTPVSKKESVISEKEFVISEKNEPITAETKITKPIPDSKVQEILQTPVIEISLAEVESKPEPIIEAEKTAPAIQKSTAQKTVPDAIIEDDFSLNAKIAKFQAPVMNVGDKLKDTPIKELVKAISISKKFEFINELFGGKPDVYKTSLQIIESSDSFESANSYIETNIADAYAWNENEKLASEFFALVKRRFL